MVLFKDDIRKSSVGAVFFKAFVFVSLIDIHEFTEGQRVHLYFLDAEAVSGWEFDGDSSCIGACGIDVEIVDLKK